MVSLPNMPFMPDDLSEEDEELLYNCWLSTELFCKTFMPVTFDEPFSDLHRQIFDILDDNTKQKVAIAAPRGFGKTSIINKAFPAKRILYQDNHYIIPISASGPAAKEFSENLKNELLTNEDMTGLFGSIRSTDTGKESKDVFSTLEWVTSTGIKVLPRGAGQQIRGRLFGNYRPDLYILDDLEDDEAVESEERRHKLKKWFLSALKNSVKYNSPNWRIIVIGTILHEDSLLSNLLNKEQFPDWTTLRLEICDDNYNSNWPERMSREQIIAEHDSYLANGMIDLFYKEFRNIPVAPETQGFKGEYFQYYNDDKLNITERMLNRDSNTFTMILADPGRSMKADSCKTAVVGLSYNVQTEAVYVRRITEELMNPAQLYDCMLDMAEELNAFILAPEVSGLEEYIMYPLTQAMLARKKHYHIVQVRPSQGKSGPKRSGGLIPLYRDRKIYHNKNECGKLERLLLMWPRPESWDIIDALSGLIFVLDAAQQFLIADDGYENYDAVEAEYDEIENEPTKVAKLIC